MSQQTDNILAAGAMHAELSQAAYANLIPGEKPDIKVLQDDADMTEAQAIAFAATYQVVDQYNSFFTGASATVFENIDTGQRHLAIRGTQLWGIARVRLDILTFVAGRL